MSMSPERWQQVESALDAVLDAEPSARAAMLDRLRRHDPGLYREVRELLEADAQAGSYLEGAAQGFVPQAEAAGPSPADPDRTLPAYSFVAAPPSAAAPPSPAAPAENSSAAGSPSSPAARRRRWMLGVGLAVLVGAIGLAVVLAVDAPAPPAAAPLAEVDDAFGEPVAGRVTLGELLERGRRREAALPPDDPARPLLRSLLGRTALRLGRHDEARRWLEGAVADARARGAEGERALATALNDEARLLHAEGALGAAEDRYREALALRKRLLPASHPDVATSLNNLGVLLLDRGAPDAADVLHDALTRRRRLYGDDHPYVASTRSSLAVLLLRAGRPSEAAEHAGAALDVCERRLGTHHPRTVAARANAAALRHALGRPAEAEALGARVLTETRALYGDDHPRTAAARHAHAVLLGQRGASDAAADAFRDALATYDATLPASHPQRARLLAAYGRLLVDQQQYRKAETLLVPAFDALQAERGGRDGATQSVAETLVTLYERWDRPSEAHRYREL